MARTALRSLPEAIVATLNGIGVKAATARNQMPHSSREGDEAVPVVGGSVKVDDRLTDRGHQSEPIP